MSPLAPKLDPTVARAPRTVDEFLRTYEGVEGRREFVDGEVIEMMTNVTLAHARVTGEFFALRSRLGRAHDVVRSGFGVATARTARFPDVMVAKRGEDAKALRTRDLIVLAQVLSPDTMSADFGDKVREYLAFPTLQHYVILSQDAPAAWLWSRSAEAGGWPDEPVFLEGEVDLPLPGLDIAVSLADLH